MIRYISLLLFLSVGLSQNRVNVNNLVQYGDKYFKENDDRPFNGIVFDLSKETGNKILEFRMVKGLKNGLYQEWYPDGNLKTKGKYLNNTQVGDWTVWYVDGQKKSEGNFKDGKKDGLTTTWYENGQKKSEGTFKDGELDGLSYQQSDEKRSINDVLLDNSYEIGRQIAEGIILSIVVGMSIVDDELVYSDEIKETTFSYGGNTWPILDVIIETESKLIGNNKFKFVLLLELGPDGAVVGTIKNMTVDGSTVNVFSMMNNTSYVETEEGTEQVQLIKGEMHFVE